MKTIRELINKSWDLVENNQIDGDLLPCLDDCEQELMAAESKLNKLLICDVMQQKLIKCFKLYKKIKADLDFYVSMRGSSFGIGVGTDEYAKKWQGKQMRLEIVEAFLEGRKTNWHFANYLDYEEKQRRNQYQNYCA